MIPVTNLHGHDGKGILQFAGIGCTKQDKLVTQCHLILLSLVKKLTFFAFFNSKMKLLTIFVKQLTTQESESRLCFILITLILLLVPKFSIYVSKVGLHYRSFENFLEI